MGYCSKGLSCTFAHGEQELVTPPNFYKTTLCIPFMNGLPCKFGTKCKFAHGQHELRPKPVSNDALCKQISSTSNLSIPSYPSETNYLPENKSTNNFSKILLQFDSLEERLSKNSLLSLPGHSESSSSAVTNAPITDFESEALLRHEQSMPDSFYHAHDSYTYNEIERMYLNAKNTNTNQTNFRDEFPN